MNSKSELEILKNIFLTHTNEYEPWIKSTELGKLLPESGIKLTKKIHANKPIHLRPPTLREFLEKYLNEVEISTPDPTKANMYKVKFKDLVLRDMFDEKVKFATSKTELDLKLQIEALQQELDIALLNKENFKNLNSLELQLEELKDNISQKENDIKEKLKDFNEIERNLNSLNANLDELDGKIKEKSIEKIQLEETLKKLKEQEKSAQELRLFLNKNEWAFPLKEYYMNKQSEDNSKLSSKKALTKTFFKDFLNELKKKSLDEDFSRIYLLSLLTSLLNGRFLLLTGHIGTGKSHLIQETGTLLSGVTELIPVRPAWLDASDLLGYFNPLNNTFIATEFTRALEKQANDTINIVLLDEMNIARIENYAADILACHNPIGQRKEITLYQDNDSLDNQIELAKILEKYSIDKNIKDNIFKDLNVNKLPNKLYLSNNLLLCGTLNIDGSTENLPPKMIDRSFMLKFPDFDGSLILGNDEIKPTEMQISSILNIFKLDKIIDEQSIQDWKSFHDEWVKSYQDILLPISRRVAMDYILFSKIAKHFGISDKLNQYFVYARLLPRMEFTHENGNFEKADKFLRDINLNITESISKALSKYQDKVGFEISYQHLCG